MKRSLVTGWIRTLALAGLLAPALSGCGETPLSAPAVSGAGSSQTLAPELISTPADEPVAFVPAPTADAHGSLYLGSGTSGSGSSGPSGYRSSMSIDGARGGTVQCGRFTVVVPPGAYAGTGTISMRIDDPALALVELDISPGDLNDFKIPVALSYDLTGLDIQDPVTIYWYDSTRRAWVDMDASSDAGHPTAKLNHFSPYGAGKAGW